MRVDWIEGVSDAPAAILAVSLVLLLAGAVLAAWLETRAERRARESKHR